MDPHQRLLRRTLRWTLGTSFAISMASFCLFYTRYWKWKDRFVRGNFVTDDGRILYDEAAIWGVLAALAGAVALGAGLALRRSRSG